MQKTDDRYAQYRGGRFNYRLTGISQAPLSDIYYLLISRRGRGCWLRRLSVIWVINGGFALLYWLAATASRAAQPGSF
ncbi:MAG: hypothetical protein R2851_14270 [Caldilineaceae bacterium]